MNLQENMEIPNKILLLCIVSKKSSTLNLTPDFIFKILKSNLSILKVYYFFKTKLNIFFIIFY